MNYLFIVQGEGRGHLSQAIALKEEIESKGNSVKKVWLGTSPQRPVAKYAKEVFGEKLVFFRSPNFLKTRDKKGVNLALSLLYNLILAPVFIRSIIILSREIRKDDYNVVMNFYDMIGGLAAYFSRTKKKMISISHHFFLTSSYFEFPSGYLFNKYFLRLHNSICAIKATEIRALSFIPAIEKEESIVKITPPILRKEILKLKIEDEGFILVYLLNYGLIREIVRLAIKFSDQKFKIYTDGISKKDVRVENIEIYELHAGNFLKELAKCHGLITTAGFESQCEAAFLGKRVFTLPSKNHFEQVCNAIDGGRAGISKPISEFENYSIDESAHYESFREWCLSRLHADR